MEEEIHLITEVMKGESMNIYIYIYSEKSDSPQSCPENNPTIKKTQ